MKKLVIVIALLGMIGCNGGSDHGKRFNCGFTQECLSQIKVGDNIESELYRDLFDTLVSYTDPIYSGKTCSVVYSLRLYVITTDCDSNMVTYKRDCGYPNCY